MKKISTLITTTILAIASTNSLNTLFINNTNNKIKTSIKNENNNWKINEINFLTTDRNRNIYALANNTVYKCLAEQTEFKQMIVPKEFANGKFIKTDKDKNTYVATNNNIYKCLATQTYFQQMIIPKELENIRFLKINERDGNVFIIANNNIYKCLAGEWEFKKMTLPTNINFLSHISIDKYGNIYITANNTLHVPFANSIYKCLENDNEFKQLNIDTNKETLQISLLTTGKDGHIYVIANNSIYKCPAEQTEFIIISEHWGLPVNAILVTDENGTIYIADNNNIYKYSVKQKDFKKINNSSIDGIIKKIIINNKNIYIITNNNSVINKVYKFDFLQSNFIEMKVIDNDTYDVSNITFDSNKNIYVLTINGIYKCPVEQTEFKKMTKIWWKTTEFYFNNGKLTDISYWKQTRNNSFIHTFEWNTEYGLPIDYRYITFFNENGTEDYVDSSYSWGDTGYPTININQVVLINAKVTKNGPINPANFCNIIIFNNKENFLLASLLITIKLGLTFYEENGKWFFQIIIAHYGETWGSESGGQIKTILGNGFRLYS
ncbi:hypothetical protein [Spiroplasma endosymbiont of Nomada rufipes]|uniref:hypothetical protein n=1 Tax=Spiroplasma endosymbiont of Nomada rufipes TaxID=3077933 RepID=UPI00376EC775